MTKDAGLKKDDIVRVTGTVYYETGRVVPFLKDPGKYLSSGDLLRISSVAEEIDHSGRRRGTVLGFVECCKSCREGNGHHIFTDAQMEAMFEKNTPDEDFVPASLLVEIAEALYLTWNPDKLVGACKVHFPRHMYAIYSANTKRPILSITEIGEYSWHEASYTVHEAVPVRVAKPLLDYWDQVSKGYEKMQGLGALLSEKINEIIHKIRWEGADGRTHA